MFWLIGIILGIVMLYFGSDWLVDGAKKLALRLGVAPFVIGLTVLAFGSSASIKPFSIGHPYRR